MADQDISVFLKLKDDMSPGLNKVSGALDKAGGQSQGLLSSFTGMAAGGVFAFEKIVDGVMAAHDALKQFNQEGIDLNRQFENTSIRIAGTLKAFNVAPTFAKAQAQAAGVMNTINDLAARLPGEAEDYISVFATALPKVIAAGMREVGEAAQFTSLYTAVAATNMVDAGQAGMDLFRMLSGQAGADVRMWTVMAEHIGMTTEAFNKLAAPQRLAKIQEAIGKFQDAMDASGASFEAVTGGVESQLKEIKRLATELSFEKSKKQLEAMSEHLKANRVDLIEGAAAMTAAYESVANTAQIAYEGFKLIGARVIGGFAKFGMGVDVGKAAREADEKAARDKEAAEAAARLRTLSADREAREAREREFREMDFSKVFELMGPKLGKTMSLLGLRGILTAPAKQELLRKGAALPADQRDLKNKILDYLEFMGFADSEADYRQMFDIRTEAEKKAEKAREEREKKATRLKTKAPQQTNFYNSRFDIKQEFAEGFDPDRIAVAFSQDLARVGEMKLQSGYAPLFAGH